MKKRVIVIKKIVIISGLIIFLSAAIYFLTTATFRKSDSSITAAITTGDIAGTATAADIPVFLSTHSIPADNNIGDNAAMSSYNGIDEELLYEKAGVFFNNGEYDKAIEYCREAIKINPDNDEAYYGLGLAYGAEGDQNGAVENFKKAIDLNPSNSMAYCALSSIYYNNNDFEKTTIYLKKAIEIDPSFVKAYYNLGAAYFEKGDYEQAIKNFEKVIVLDPSDVEAYYNLGRVFLEVNDINRARDNFKIAAQMCNLTNPERAREIEKIFEIIPVNENKAERYYKDGIKHLNAKRINKAIESFERVILLRNDTNKMFICRAYYNLGRICVQQYEFEKGLKLLKRAVEINPDYADAYYGLGDVYTALSDKKKAYENYKKSYELFEKEGRRGKARIVLRKKLSDY